MHTCNPNAREEETGRPLGLSGQLAQPSVFRLEVPSDRPCFSNGEQIRGRTLMEVDLVFYTEAHTDTCLFTLLLKSNCSPEHLRV